MSTEIATFAPDNPVAVLSDAKQFDALLGRIQAEVDAHVPDLETAKGRAAIKSLAYKVTRTKTALDDAGKELNATKRAEIDAVDAVRRDVRAKLDALADKARKPLDEWEAAEAERKAQAERVLITIDGYASAPGDTAAEISASIASLDAIILDPLILDDAMEIAVARKLSVRGTMDALLAKAIQAEADAAELAKLRAAEQERIAAAEAEAEAKRKREEADAAEAAAAAAEKAAEDKRKADIAAAEERARTEAARKAEQEAQAKIDAANAEAARLQAAENARAAEAKKEADAQAAREADKAHRGAVMKAAKEAIMAHGGVNDDTARKIVLAIVAGEVPAVTLRF